MTAIALDALALAELAAGRLHDDGLGGAQVYGALDAVPERGAARNTLVLVLPATEAGDANRADHGVVQRMTLTISVAIAVRASNDARGRRALAGLRRPRDAVKGLLAGWRPEGAATALAHLRGQLSEIADGRAWWQDDYALDAWVQRPESS